MPARRNARAIVRRALEESLRQIARDAGHEGPIVVKHAGEDKPAATGAGGHGRY